MGCCTSGVPTPQTEDIASYKYSVNSFTESNASSRPSFHDRPSASTKQYRMKQEPQMSPRCLRTSHSSSPDSMTPAMSLQYTKPKNSFEIRVDKRKTEMLQKQQALQDLQDNAFVRQLTSLSSRKFKRLYDVFQEYAHYENGDTYLDMDGLTQALGVFGMIIDTNCYFQKHIFAKFDLDNEDLIAYNDFSATMACFVGNVTDDESLQTLFEIFDIDQDGFLRCEDIARILLSLNQITVVVTGQQHSKNSTIYNKQQTLKQARRMIAEHTTTSNDKIPFDEFKQMMKHRTEDDMLIDHMQAPSISINGMVTTMNDIRNTIFVPIPNE